VSLLRGRHAVRPPRSPFVALGTLLAALVAVAALAGAIPAAAQSGDAAAPSLELVQQTAWVGPDGVFQVALRGDGLPAGAEVRAELYRAVRTRAALDAAVADQALGRPIWTTPRRTVAEATSASDGTFVVTLPVSVSSPTAPDGVQLSTPGVYPMVVQVYAAGSSQPIAHLTTTMLRLGATGTTPASRLSVGVVVPLVGDVAPADDGTPTLDEASAAGLSATIDVVGARTDVPLTLTPSPESLSLLNRDQPDGTSALAGLKSLVSRQVLAAPYAPIDTGGWVDAGLGGEMDDQYAAGTGTLTNLLATRPDTSTAVLDPSVSEAALARLKGLGATSVVVPSGQLDALSDRTRTTTFADQFEIDAGDAGPLKAVVADDGVAARLVSTDDPVLAGHRALAELAILQLNQTGSAHGLAVVVPTATDPATLATLLAGLADPTGTSSGSAGEALVSPVTVADLFTTTQVATTTVNGRSTTLVRGYRAAPPADLGRYPAALRSARTSLDGLLSLVPSAPTVTDPVTLAVLSSGSRTLTTGEQLATLAGAASDTAAITAEIVVSPEQVVTLTSSSGRVPLNLENRLQVPARVRIVLNSAKLDFPEGSVIEQELPPAQTTLVDLPVETRASGAFPLAVTITSADGNLPVATSTYTVRSTAISGVGLVLSVGAGLFLLVWWARHFRTTRRARKLVASNHPARSGTGPGGYAPPQTEPTEPDAGRPALDTDPQEGP
jgi:hypothetical protein